MTNCGDSAKSQGKYNVYSLLSVPPSIPRISDSEAGISTPSKTIIHNSGEPTIEIFQTKTITKKINEEISIEATTLSQNSEEFTTPEAILDNYETEPMSTTEDISTDTTFLSNYEKFVTSESSFEMETLKSSTEEISAETTTFFPDYQDYIFSELLNIQKQEI